MNKLILAALLLSVSATVHAGFTMYVPGQKAPAMSTSDEKYSVPTTRPSDPNGSMIELESGQYAVEFTHEEGVQAAVRIFDYLGQEVGIVQSEPSADGGAGNIFIPAKGWYTVYAIGCYHTKIYKGHVSEYRSKKSQEPIHLDGKGQRVLGPYRLSKGYYSFHYEHTGEHNFILHAVLDGTKQKGLVNEIGKVNGEVGLLLPNDAQCFFEIIADGDWFITISPRNTLK